MNERIAELLEEAAHLLPEQGPLQTFVHHNTLHAFEHLPFADAVVRAGALFGAEPFPSEDELHGYVVEGRIAPADLDAVVAAEVADDGVPVVPGGPTRRQFHARRLRHLVVVPRGPALRWLLAESGDLGPVWAALLAAAPRVVPAADPTPRPRDRVLAETGVDTDRLTHPVLTRLAAAFLDQGVAYWPMHNRDKGFLDAFRGLYGRAGGPPDRFLRGLGDCLRAQSDWDAERVIAWALTELDVPEPEWGDAVLATLLSLRGWAGMVRQFETRPDRAPVAAHPARLADYLAVQLTLDLFALRRVLANTTRHLVVEVTARPDVELAYEAFVLAELMGVDPTPAPAAWLSLVGGCDEVERRRLLHAAYERRHRIGVLDGLAAHQNVSTPDTPPVRFQAVFCIDEREESLRRHLEEHHPGAETFGFAGFFGVAMNYQGLHDVRPRPLCPVVVTPNHDVRERAVAPARTFVRRAHAGWTHHVAVGSRTLARGGVLSVAMGVAGLCSLVTRCLFPRHAHRWAHRLAGRHPVTRLELGYTTDEMAGIVGTVLRTTGVLAAPAPVVVLVGHGSSSMNNPHESAHDCGATGGGRGGPNARAFAAMANHPEVRSRLGLPEGTWFVGAYHNTCDDTMTYFDEDLVPERFRADLARAQDALADACVLAAHERCRRFETAAPDLSLADALAHAETHAVDLGQPRPEYGHATNAVCVVGRRSRTRGLYLDRRAFLVSYDPAADPDDALLTSLLLAVGPVCAGINLEYYFSYVDPARYGCGTKLPHNITGLLGVMDGHSSDLRTGLPWQMVEIHEPVRLLLVVEATPERLSAILAAHANLARLVGNGWIQLVAWTEGNDMHLYQDGAFQPYTPETAEFPVVERSSQVYAGHRGHLGPAHVLPGAPIPVPALDFVPGFPQEVR
ncbi:DUF2309 domain-containing protein [Actinokineospora auranticolor]|uniref:Probable inorganic carbon transporter subunit DabA n=1 Tax=Actinokineospora auranticolor TaxID=155976 RepID=A0A2S6GXF9_9PSEU|nr:DUF2309 domain-containing protein [Actinokineospora auranticolor]PPK69893.1 hypothetical protein CLV40_103503 [Actinokineospora auranticolor]